MRTDVLTAMYVRAENAIRYGANFSSLKAPCRLETEAGALSSGDGFDPPHEPLVIHRLGSHGRLAVHHFVLQPIVDPFKSVADRGERLDRRVLRQTIGCGRPGHQRCRTSGSWRRCEAHWMIIQSAPPDEGEQLGLRVTRLDQFTGLARHLHELAA